MTERAPINFLTSAVVVWVCGIAPLAAVIVPLLIPPLEQSFGISAQMLGMLAAADLAGACVATISAPFWLRYVGVRRGVMLGLLVIMTANAGSLLAFNTETLLLSRLLAGIGTGATLGSIIPLIGAAKRPARVVSAAQLFQMAVGALALLGAPWMIERFGATAMFGVIILFAALTLPVAALLPRAMRSQASAQQSSVLAAMRPAALVLAGILVYFIGAVVISSFSGKLGVAHGLSLAAIGGAMALGNLGGIPGSALAAWLAAPKYRAPLLIGATLVQVVAVAVMVLVPNIFAYAIAGFFISAGITVIAPLQVAALVDQDKGGRAIEGLAAMQSLGQAVGPLLGGLFITAQSTAGAYVFAVLCCALSLAAVCWRAPRAVAPVSAQG